MVAFGGDFRWLGGGEGSVYGCSPEELVVQFSNRRIHVGRQGEWRVSRRHPHWFVNRYITLDGQML